MMNSVTYIVPTIYVHVCIRITLDKSHLKVNIRCKTTIKDKCLKVLRSCKYILHSLSFDFFTERQHSFTYCVREPLYLYF